MFKRQVNSLRHTRRCSWAFAIKRTLIKRGLCVADLIDGLSAFRLIFANEESYNGNLKR